MNHRRITNIFAPCLLAGLWIFCLAAAALPAAAAPLYAQPGGQRHPLPPEVNPGNENWAAGFHVGALDGALYALAADNKGTLYVGGVFITAGALVTHRVARWDGSNWSALGDADHGFNSTVRALAVDTDGSLYAAGDFTALCADTTCSTTVPGYNRIAKWDGAAWRTLGAADHGFNQPVRALAMGGSGSLYAAGDFTALCADAACSTTSPGYNHIAIWQSGAWSRLGAADFGLDATVRTLAVDHQNGILYAGGAFTGLCQDAACDPAQVESGYHHIARWDGGWSVPGSAAYGFNSEVYALALDGSATLYAGGNFIAVCTNEDCTSITLGFNSLARLSAEPASAWQALGSGVNNSVYALSAASDGSLYAGGVFTRLCLDAACSSTAQGYNRIARWDGNAWGHLGDDDLGVNDIVYALGFYDAQLHAGGSFSKICLDNLCSMTGAGYNRLARWDGSAWNPLGDSGAGFNNVVSSLAVDSAGVLYAGGVFNAVGASALNRIARWDGIAWGALGAGDHGFNSSLSALTFDSAGALYAGGDFTALCGDASCSTSNLLPGYNRVARWDGAAWSTLGANDWGLFGAVRALAVDDQGHIYAGGDFTELCGDAPCSKNNRDPNYYRLVVWDGSQWKRLGVDLYGFDGPVYALAFDSSGRLYVGGGFTALCGDANCTPGKKVPGYHNIARWDGANWERIGTGNYGFNASVSALKFDAAGNLYAAGNFTALCLAEDCGALSPGVNRLARWNGSAWSALGAADLGFDNEVKALALDGAGNLYAAGSFTAICTAPDCSSLTPGYLRIARWDGAAWQPHGSGLNSSGSALAYQRSGSLFVGGAFTLAGAQVSSYISHWTAAAVQCGLQDGGDYSLYLNNLPVQVHVNAGGTLDCLSAQRVNRSHPFALPEMQTGYYWALRAVDESASPASGFDVDLTLPYAQADNGDVVCRYSGAGTDWSCAATSYQPGVSVTLANVTGFSTWTVGNYFPTAVTMAGFQAHAQAGLVHLTWQTALELDMLGFNLYRSASPDGARLPINAALIPAQGVGLEGARYAFTDFSPLRGAAAYYWLEVINLDGSTEWIDPLQAQAGHGAWFPLILK